MLAWLWFKMWNALNFLYGFFQWGSVHRLRSLKNACKGKRCFIVGNGPSLRSEDLRLLHERGEFTFACNSLIRLFEEIPFRPSFYFAQDNKIILDNKELINSYTGTKFIKAHYARRYHLPGVTYYNMRLNPKGFSKNIPLVVYSGQTVVYSMIQFAVYMGFSEIYLIGVDCNYSPGNTTISADSYFDKRLFNGKRHYAPPEVNTNLLAYECARDECKKMGVNILNASRGGKLEIFSRVDFDTLF